MTLKKSAAVAVALLLSLAAVGCGSKKDDSASSDAAGSAEKQSQGNGDNSTTTTEDDGSTTTTSGSTSDALNSLANGNLGDCLGTSLAYAKLVLAPLGFASGASQDQIDQFEKDTQDLEAKIPSELKDDFATVADAYKEYGETLKGIDFTDLGNSDTLNKLEDASNKMESPDVKAAQDRIQAYFDDNCGN